MKKKLLRLSKRILILVLCTTLISGAVFNKCKVTANAAAMTATVGTYAAYEICMYVGGALLACLGLGTAIDNRDKIAELGKNFIDSMNLDGVSEWLLTKVNAAGQSYVFGSEALKEVQDMSFTVIQGGGNMPENNNDNDDDGDIDADDRTEELKNLGLWATSSFVNMFCEYIEPLIQETQAGQDNILTDALLLNVPSFNGYQINDSGYYLFSGYFRSCYADTGGISGESILIEHSNVYKNPIVLYLSEDCGSYLKYKFGEYRNGKLNDIALSFYFKTYDKNGNITQNTSSQRTDVSVGNVSAYYYNYFHFNIPMFSSSADALSACQLNDFSGALNASKTYIIADWLQEHWLSALEQLNTGIRSLYDNMLIVGEAANQALLNQLDGLGYIENLEDLISGAQPLPLPEEIADPVYVPGDSPAPELGPGDLPWVTPTPVPDPTPGDGGAGDDGSVPDDEIRGDDSFGINTIFSILILLIMILLMLLMIFLSCLAFIIMIFRIPASTGFLPEEMVAGLDYLKTLQIPGFGMSVYAFFMALIYIILIFTVIGILRKNIDKIKFPRKGKW